MKIIVNIVHTGKMHAMVKRFQIENTPNVWQTAEARKVNSEFRITYQNWGETLFDRLGRQQKGRLPD
jgi:hypothetical protein